MAKRWYVVQTKPSQENLAVQQLKNQKFTVFFPNYIHKTKSKKTGKVLKRVMPFFPSYMFIQFDVKRNKRWQSIRSTRGVAGLIGCGETYLSPLPEGCIEAILKRASKSGTIKLEETIEKIIEFSPGMQLQVRGENYEGLIGTYCNHSEKRVTLLLTLLNRKIKVTLPLDAVQPIKVSNGGGGSIQSPQNLKTDK